eukprot:TRINITY_DN6853_c0_g1_i1.p1 TRINITY_DN6853_c0_g1~~TRINITY_DN6853_c0_g1_i1.p1  ORF type:complete len:100 (+),score=19.55 TRINITY_DN6853_c0_g1_i1:226-525(+)
MFEVKKAEPVLQTYDAFHGDEFLVVPKPVKYFLLQSHHPSGDGTTTITAFSDGIVVNDDDMKTMSPPLFKGTVPSKLEPTVTLLNVEYKNTLLLCITSD